MLKHIPVSALLALGLMPISGWAQDAASANQIIRSLRPTAGMTGSTRGIRPAAPVAGHMPAATLPTSPMPAMTSGGAPSVNLNVQFRTSSTKLTPTAMRTLDQLGRALSDPVLSGYRFRIEGHTDTVGSPETNKALSERRAQTVVDYLVSKYGLDRDRLQAIGMGEEGLRIQTPPQTPDIRNRRVQVVNIGA